MIPTPLLLSITAEFTDDKRESTLYIIRYTEDLNEFPAGSYSQPFEGEGDAILTNLLTSETDFGRSFQALSRIYSEPNTINIEVVEDE